MSLRRVDVGAGICLAYKTLLEQPADATGINLCMTWPLKGDILLKIKKPSHPMNKRRCHFILFYLKNKRNFRSWVLFNRSFTLLFKYAITTGLILIPHSLKKPCSASGNKVKMGFSNTNADAEYRNPNFAFSQSYLFLVCIVLLFHTLT